jgi:hypothetical protein
MAHLVKAWTAIEVVDVPGAGRGCCTTRAVAAGELLCSAAPYAVALDATWLETVCLGCAKAGTKPHKLRCEARGARRRGGCAIAHAGRFATALGAQHAAADASAAAARPQDCKGAYFCSSACRDGAGRQRHAPVCGWEASVVGALRAAAASAEEPLSLEPHEETTARLVLATVMAHAQAEAGGERATERGAPTYRDVLAQAAPLEPIPPRTAALAALTHAAFLQARCARALRPRTRTHAGRSRAAMPQP